jgi:hypothetical protein
MLPVMIQAQPGHFLRASDQNIAQYAREILNNVGVTPIAPVREPTEGHLDTPERGAEQPDEVADAPPLENNEGERYLSLIPKHVKGGDVKDLSEFPAKAETKFKEIVLKVAEPILPEKGGKVGQGDKGTLLEKVAEVVENQGNKALDSIAKDLHDKSTHSIKSLVQNQSESSSVSGNPMERVTEMKHPGVSEHHGAHSHVSESTANLLIADSSNNQTTMLLTPGGDLPLTMTIAGQQTPLTFANALLIPMQASLTKEGVQAITQANSEVIDHRLHQHTLNQIDSTTTVSTPPSNDIQGLTIALTLPLGLLPVSPAQLVGGTEAAKALREGMMIESVAHRSLHREHFAAPAATDTIPIGIPSDRPNLFPIPDGREITYIAQMAQMGMFRGKRVEDSKFRMGDGLQLDPGYRLGDLFAIAYLAVLCGASSMTQIGAFVEEHEKWLGRNFDLRRGAPAPLVFMWLFTRVKPAYLTKIILQHIEAITDRSHGRRSRFNAIRMWETNSGLIFGQSKTENRAPSQSQMIRIFDWEDATFILEPAADPDDVRRDVNCRLLMSVDGSQKDLLLKGQKPITSKSQEWNDAYDVISNLELTLYPEWTVGQYKKTQEGVLKINRSFLSNLPLDFNAWNTLFYDRTDVEEQTHWVGEGRFLSFGDVTVSHATDNFELLLQAAHKALLAATNVTGSVEQKRRKLWEDPDELLILIGY